jgi:hypothetical protein
MITSHASVNAVESGPLGRLLKQRGGLCWKREFGGILKFGRAAMRLREIGVSTALASAAVAALIFVNGGV